MGFSFKLVQKVLLHLLVIGFLFGPTMYVNDMLLGYYTQFPNSIIYYWLWYLLGYFLIALLFIALYQGLVKALQAEEKFIMKCIISTTFCLLLSSAICMQAINNNNLKTVLIVWLNLSLSGVVYVLIESNIKIFKISGAVDKVKGS